MRPDRLLQKWKQQVPRDGAPGEELIAVMRHLKMEVRQRKSGHWTGTHPALVGSAYFPQGLITVSCHAFGIEGRAHPSAVRDVVRAARVIEEAQSDEEPRRGE
jgi:hypothetical protein